MSNAAFGPNRLGPGVYTAEQSARGQAAYSQYCSRCHKADLLGIEGSHEGEPFMERRREDNLETLFLDMKATMPRGNPGGLPDQTYTDILSYILQKNDMPTGTDELKPNALGKVQLVGKDGPKPVPNFALVLSVGCLVQTGQDSWKLTQASEPVRTRDSFKKIEKELADCKRAVSGLVHIPTARCGGFRTQASPRRESASQRRARAESRRDSNQRKLD